MGIMGVQCGDSKSGFADAFWGGCDVLFDILEHCISVII